jgi:tRNA1Val (adenine37-N6)-methyltransferase
MIFLIFEKKLNLLPNQYFQFKQFKIQQDKTAMKVGTDGVLLGAWASAKACRRILDVGTGTGLIAIMMAQRSNAEIDAVEPEENAFIQARENINNCPWRERIYLRNMRLQDFAEHHESLFDLIVTNPPWFSKSLSSPSQERTRARHTVSLSYHDLLDGSNKMLNEEGILSLILPYGEKKVFIDMATNKGLFCKRITHVKPLPGRKPKRVLLEFSYREEEPVENQITIEKGPRHVFTEEYVEMTKDFYLYF